MPCCALAQRFERAALRVDRAVGIAFAELVAGLAHRVAGAAERVRLAALLALLALLARLREALLAQFLEQLAELLAQRLLVLAQIAHLVAVALLALLTLLTALAALILALLEGAVAQLLLPLDHLAELVEHRLHVVVAIALLAAGPGHLQVVEHLAQLVEHLLGGVARAGARQALHAVEHAAQILRAKLAHLVAVERPRHLRVLAQLLGQRLHELVERRAKLVHQLLDLFVGRAALQRLAQRVLRRPKLLLDLGDVAVLEHHRHRPQPRHHVAQTSRRSRRA